jgi:hypothetical protein
MARKLRKADVAQRYGNIENRTVERKVEHGLIPPPDYLFQNRIPFWDEEELDAHDRAAVTAVRTTASLDDITRLIQRISAASSHTEALSVFCAFRLAHTLATDDVEKIVDIMRKLRTRAAAA